MLIYYPEYGEKKKEFPISEDGITESQLSEVTLNPETEDIPLAKKLQLAIDASMQIPQNSLSLDNTSLPTILKYEITVAEQTGKRGYYLDKVYQMMLTLPATSFEVERTFSSCTYLCNKLRSRLNDDTLDVLCFIRNNLKKSKIN